MDVIRNSKLFKAVKHWFILLTKEQELLKRKTRYMYHTQRKTDCSFLKL